MSGTRSLHKAYEACRPLKARRPFPLSTGAINRNQTTQFDLGSGRPSRQISTSGGCRYAKPTELPSTQQLRPKSRASPLRPEVPISSIPNTSRTLSTSSSVPADNAPSPSVTSSSSSNAVAAAAPKSSTTDKDQGQPLRLPRSVQAAYLKPLRIPPTHGLPVCSLQLRSFSVRNLEFMADFAMRAAYYLGLPAKGPVPLPRKIERWTLSKSNFVHTKTKENFERITLKRAIEIQDGEAEVVKIWLAYLRRHAFWGVGMKANIWEFESLDVARNMDKAYKDIETDLHDKLSSFGWKASVADQRSLSQHFKEQHPHQGELPGRPMMHLRRDSRSAKQPHKTEPVY